MLRSKTTTGILWNFAQQLSTKGVSIIVTLLLARFLTPEDFGLMAMMAVFIAVATTLMESGFREALIRKKDATQIDFSTGFYCNIFIGLISYFLLFISAPYIAEFYTEPRLIDLIRITGLIVIISSLQVIQIVILSRELNFKTQLKANVPASIISGIAAVILAYYGFGIWALIYQMIISTILATIFLWSARAWRPTLEFNAKAAGEMFSFGYKLFLSSLIDTIFRNLYVIVIAKFFSTSIAGYYFFAERIKELVINQLVKAIQNVTYPALATMQDDDIKLKEGYRKVLQVTTYVLFPAMLFLAALTEPLFHAFLPNKWLPAVPYLQLLCLSGVAYPLHAINLNILKVKGRSDLFLYLEIIKKIIMVIFLTISFQYGIFGILIGQVMYSLIAYIPNSYFSARLIDYSLRSQFGDFIPSLLLSTFIASTIYVLVSSISINPWTAILVYGSVGTLLYLAISFSLKMKAAMYAKTIFKERVDA